MMLGIPPNSMELNKMEKLIRKYTIDEVCELIDKHIELNRREAETSALKRDDEMLHSHCGAMTGLELLKRELKGEADY